MTRLQTLLFTLPPIDLPCRASPLKEFTLFQKLPPELRVKVVGYSDCTRLRSVFDDSTILICLFTQWRYTTQVTRKVKLFELGTVSTEDGWDSRIQGQVPIPGVIHACRESISEGRKVYKLCYEKPQPAKTIVRMKEHPGEDSAEDARICATQKKVRQKKNSNAIYVNFRHDIFVIMPFSQGSTPKPPHDHPLRRTIFPREVDYNHSVSCLDRIQRLEYLHYSGISLDIGFLYRSPIREATWSVIFRYSTTLDDVGGDLARCAWICNFESKVKKALEERKWRTVVPWEDICFRSRYVENYGEDLDPSSADATPALQFARST